MAEPISGPKDTVLFEGLESVKETYRDSLAKLVDWVANCLLGACWVSQDYFPWSVRTNVKIAASVLFHTFPTLVSVAPVILGSGLKKIVDNVLQAREYRVDKGTFNKEVNKNTTVITFNSSMRRGVIPSLLWRSASAEEQLDLSAKDRLKPLISTIRKVDPEIVFLPEVSDSAGRSLWKAVSKNYNYRFSNMGNRIFGMSASFEILFRGEPKALPKFISFQNQDWFRQRGFFILETDEVRYFCTYYPTLSHLKEICKEEEKKMSKKKAIIMGPLGFKKDSESFRYLEKKGFDSGSKKKSLIEKLLGMTDPLIEFFNIEEKENRVEGGTLFIKH